MKNSKFVIDKFAKLFEQGLISSKDLGDELLTILKSKRDEIIPCSKSLPSLSIINLEFFIYDIYIISIIKNVH